MLGLVDKGDMIRFVCLALLLLDVVFESSGRPGTTLTEKISKRQERTLSQLVELNKSAKRWQRNVEKSVEEKSDEKASDEESVDNTSESAEERKKWRKKRRKAEKDEELAELIDHLFG